LNPWTLSCLSILLSLLSPSVTSQDSTEYDKWKQGYLNEFASYKDEIDRDFANFLKQKWKKFDVEKGVERDPVPKPDSIPREKPKIAKALKPVTPEIKPDESSEDQQAPIINPVATAGEKVSFVFLGHDVTIFVEIDRKFELDGAITQKSLQTGFDHLAQSDYENLIADLAEIRKSLRLNDWAYMQLIDRFSKSFVPNSTNSARLLSWFLLLKSGVKSRLAFADNEIYLLVSTQQPLYSTTYFKFENEKFYVVSRHERIAKNLYSYNGAYPKQLPTSDFAGISNIIAGKTLDYRKISFEYGGTAYDIRVPYNKHVIDFFSSYPQMDIEHYFNVAISQDTQQALLTQLEPLVAQLSKQEAVNFLLRLVQTGFDYKTDQVQFGKENYLFLEETIYYPSSDCEDRSVIFAWLVENLLDLKVVGLSFPGHVATAVQLDNPSGEPIEHDGEVFSIADPTYIYASVGKKMPQFKSITPKVISHYQ